VVGVAHAAFARERSGLNGSLARLLDDLEKGGTHPTSVILTTSYKLEHASVWAPRLHRALLETDGEVFALLNDDVRVCPRFVEVVGALAEAAPGEPISLHTTHREVTREKLGPSPARWMRSWWMTGPAQLWPRLRLEQLVAWYERRKEFADAANEDNCAIQFAYEQLCRPILGCIPAVAKHDVSVPSLLGFDDHLDRVPHVTWESFPWPADLTKAAWWGTPGPDVHYLANPWAHPDALERFKPENAFAGITVEVDGEP
jgi:hypothetical protein